MGKITHENLKKLLATGKLSNLYFLYGVESFLIKFYEEKIIELIRKSNNNSLETIILDGENLDFANFVLSIQTLPFGFSAKCIIVKDLVVENLGASGVNKFIELISNIPKFCTIVISQRNLDIDNKKVAKYKKIIEFVDANGEAVQISPRLSDSDIKKMLNFWAKENKKSFSSESENLLINRVGKNLTLLKNETEKLCAYSDNDVIESEAVLALTAESFEVNVFDLCKSIMAKNYRKSLEQLEILIQQKEEPIKILSAIASSYYDVYLAKIASNSGKTVTEITKNFNYKGKEFRIKIASSYAQNISKDNIKRIIKNLMSADATLKTVSLDSKIVLTNLILQLTLT